MNRVSASGRTRPELTARLFVRRAALSLLFLAGTAGELRAVDLGGGLQIFGHFTQAYGESSVGRIVGTAEGGSTDLRKIAVQLRWERSESDLVVIQLSHERLGDDIFEPQEDEVEIDWAFYERRIGSNSALKIGRLNIPLGIYNEVRDIGTVLPFFNLPVSFYTGVLSSAETVDGLSLEHTFGARSQWPVEVDLYFGGWDTFQQQVHPDADFNLVNFEARAEDGIGVQLWLDTPIQGVRLGAGSLTWLLDGPLSVPGTKDRWHSYHLSVDVNLEKFMFRGEVRSWDFDLDFGSFLNLGASLPARAERDGYYLQLGYWVTPKIGLFGQLDDVALDNDVGIFADVDDFHHDLALSLNYRLESDLLLKAEFHRADTRFPLGTPEIEQSPELPPIEVDWALVSLSVSF